MYQNSFSELAQMFAPFKKRVNLQRHDDFEIEAIMDSAGKGFYDFMRSGLLKVNKLPEWLSEFPSATRILTDRDNQPIEKGEALYRIDLRSFR